MSNQYKYSFCAIRRSHGFGTKSLNNDRILLFVSPPCPPEPLLISLFIISIISIISLVIDIKLDASWRVKFEYVKNKMTWHKEILHYWNRVYYCGLDYHNNHFYSVSFSFNAHGAVFSQTSHHKEVRVTVMAKVKWTPTHVLMLQDWFSLSTIYTFIITNTNKKHLTSFSATENHHIW